MTQVTTYSLPDGSGDDVWLALQAILPAIRDFNSGPTAPPSPVAHMPWIDTSTSPWTFRIRNADNSAWVTLMTGLGATATGTAVFTSVNAAAARGAIAAPAIPTASGGVGQVVNLFAPDGTALALPAGGTWQFKVTLYTGAGTYAGSVAGVQAGGSAITGTGTIKDGFAWRIA